MMSKIAKKDLRSVTGGVGVQDAPNKTILRDDCVDCGVCEAECPLKAIQSENCKAVRDNDICDGGNCERCPQNCPFYFPKR